MQHPFPVGTLVMLVKIGGVMDGATGTVRKSDIGGIGPCACGCGQIVLARGYLIALSRPTSGNVGVIAEPQHVVPILPPDPIRATGTETPIDLGVVI